MLTLLVVALLFLPIWFIPMQVRLLFRQRNWQARGRVQVRAPFLRLGRSFDLTALAAEGVERVIRHWRLTGEPIAIRHQQAIRRFPGGALWRTAQRPLSYLGRRTRARRVRFTAVVGGRDAMESALLAGGLWAVAGSALGFVREVTGAQMKRPQICIRPNFTASVWRVRASCILQIRLGHAIVAGAWIFWRAIRSPKLRAAWRRNRGRKGVDGGVRPSDSRPDENGHGEP